MKWLKQAVAVLHGLNVALRFGRAHYISVIFFVWPLLLAGCSASDGLSIDCNAFEDNLDQVAEITIAEGEQFNVALCSMRNHGYRWTEEEYIDNPEVLVELSREYEPGRSPMGGIPGVESWIFRAVEPGTAVITLEHTQLSGRNARGIWTYRLVVTVEAAVKSDL